LERVAFVGIDPPHLKSKPGAMIGVTEAVGDWADDCHGRGTKLASKRERRNIWRTWQGAFAEGTEDVEKGALRTVGSAKDEVLAEEKRPW
jgi:hypothetical protein